MRDAIEEFTFKRNKIMRKQINNLIIALAFISTLGCLVGCVKKEREKSRQAQTVTSSTTKEDKETIKTKAANLFERTRAKKSSIL